MGKHDTDYRLCTSELERRVYKVAEDAKLPEELTRNIINAGKRMLQSKPVHSRDARITANDLVDLLEMLYAKTGPQFVPIIKRLAEGALSVPAEKLRDWYTFARQVSSVYTNITPQEQKRISDALSASESPDILRRGVAAIHHEEIRRILEEHPSLAAVKRNGRISEHASRTKSPWNMGKEKEI